MKQVSNHSWAMSGNIGNYKPKWARRTPEEVEVIEACLLYYRATEVMDRWAKKPHSECLSKLRKLRYELGLSAKDLRTCKEIAERKFREEVNSRTVILPPPRSNLV